MSEMEEGNEESRRHGKQRKGREGKKEGTNGSVELGDQDGRDVGVLVSKGVPDRLESLAVMKKRGESVRERFEGEWDAPTKAEEDATNQCPLRRRKRTKRLGRAFEKGHSRRKKGDSPPRSVELNENVLLESILPNDLLVLVADEGPNALLLGGRDSSTLDVGLDLSSLEALDELLDGASVPLDGSAALERVLGLSGEVLNHESRPGLDVEVERLGVVDELDGVDPDERELSFVLGGDGLEGLDELVVGLLLLGVDEGVGQRDASLRVGSEVLRRDLGEERDSVDLDPRSEGLSGEGGEDLGGEDVLSLVEGLVEDDGGFRGRETGEREGLGIRGRSEEVGVSVGVGEDVEGLVRLGSSGSVGDEDAGRGGRRRRGKVSSSLTFSMPAADLRPKASTTSRKARPQASSSSGIPVSSILELDDAKRNDELTPYRHP